MLHPIGKSCGFQFMATEYYTGIKKEQATKNATTWINPREMMSVRNQM